MNENRAMNWMSGDRVPGNTRPHRRVGVLLTLAVLPVLLAGCGSDAAAVTPQAPVGETAAAAPTKLTIVNNDGAGKIATWTLTCDPTGGTHPDAAAACAALTAKGKTSMPAVAKNQVCTQQYGGPQTAKITGTWNNEAVNTTFSRKNGCEISRWTALKGLLPETAGVGAQ